MNRLRVVPLFDQYMFLAKDVPLSLPLDESTP